MADPIDPEDIAALEVKAAAGNRAARAVLGRIRDRDMRRQIVLRAINQGALAGMGSEISEHAADLVIDALDAYDSRREEEFWAGSHPWDCVPVSMFRQAVQSRQRWQARADEVEEAPRAD